MFIISELFTVKLDICIQREKITLTNLVSRANINSRTQLHLWVQQHPQLLIDFPQRTTELIPITNEAVELLLQTGKLVLTPNAELEVSPTSRILSKTKYVDSEIAECLLKCEHIARWFATAGKVENIYIELGVRP